MTLEGLEALEQLVDTLESNMNLCIDLKNEVREFDEILPMLPQWVGMKHKLTELTRLYSGTKDYVQLVLAASAESLGDTEECVEEKDELSQLIDEVSQDIGAQIRDQLQSGNAKSFSVEVNFGGPAKEGMTLH